MSKEIINEYDYTTCPSCGYSICTRYKETGAGIVGETLAFGGGIVTGIVGGLFGNRHLGHAAHHAIKEGMSSTKIYCKCKSCGHKWQVG